MVGRNAVSHEIVTDGLGSTHAQRLIVVDIANLIGIGLYHYVASTLLSLGGKILKSLGILYFGAVKSEKANNRCTGSGNIIAC